MDLIIKNARLVDQDTEVSRDIGVDHGQIVAIEPEIKVETKQLDIQGCLLVPGFVESHLHLDKAGIIDDCQSQRGSLKEAIAQVSALKASRSIEHIQARAQETLEKCILQGTTRVRTHLEVDPVIGRKSLDAIVPMVDEYKWAVDLEICVFPQEGMLNNPGTEALMRFALNNGATVVGGCPYTDSDPIGQIDRVFELAREFDVDIDFHLDFDTNPSGSTIERVCENTERYGWQNRVAIGHVSKLSAFQPQQLARVSQRMSDVGISLAVLPATDLFLMGGEAHSDVVRGVAPIHKVATFGVNCALSTNNVLNPFTPFGDCSMVRMANLYANIGRIGDRDGHRACLDYITHNAAKLMRLPDYGIAVGNPADFVVLDCDSPERAVRELATPLMSFKRGHQVFERARAQLFRPNTAKV